MREIKFRAWDEGNKVMHHDFQFFKSGEEGNDWVCFCSDKESLFTEDPKGIIFNNPYFRQQMKIMQFTGLHDKNGKEIYEGDLLEEEPGYLFEVAWHTDLAKFLLVWRTKAIQYPEWNRGRKMAVVGNVYENPELLKEG